MVLIRAGYIPHENTTEYYTRFGIASEFAVSIITVVGDEEKRGWV